MKKHILFACAFIFATLLNGQNCECGKGIGSYGDPPEFIYSFSDMSSISFCGGIHEMNADSSFHASEFSVFTCDGKDKLASYSAIHSCIVTMKNNTVLLDRIIYLYNGKGKEWKLYPLSQRTIKLKDNAVHISDEYVILTIPSIDLVDAKSVLSTDYEHMDYRQISDFLGQLEILALNKHPEAVDLLFSKELEDATNAASTEHLTTIRATYNWVVKGIKNERYW